VAFGPSGRLFTGGPDTVVLRWDVQPPRSAAKGNLADAWEALADADGKTGFQAQASFSQSPARRPYGSRLGSPPPCSLTRPA
jgi:hypothetical protein